jgi:AraC family transcriptional regulator
MEVLACEVSSDRIGRDVIATSLVTELSILLMRRFAGAGSSLEKGESHQPSSTWRVRRALGYLSHHSTEEFSLDQLAKESGLSKYYLDRVFRLATGLTPHNYVVALRLARAKCLLCTSGRAIADIAVELGFSDQSHFSKVFKDLTGQSPKRFRAAQT